MARSWAVAFIALPVLLQLSMPSSANPGTTERVSVSSDGAQANERSGGHAMTTDGRYVAFDSDASNLVPGDTNGASDVFVRDRQAQTTELVSVALDTTQASGSSYGPSLSSDGRYVAFYSDAANLVADDTNGHGDIFVRDQELGWTVRVSLSSSGAQPDRSSSDARISADGRFVAFTSDATNLVPNNRYYYDVFVHDLEAGTTELVSVSVLGGQANASSFAHSLSADGRFALFISDATDLVPGDSADSIRDIFLRDRVNGTTEIVSLGASGEKMRHPSAGGMSADGRFVVFSAEEKPFEEGGMYIRDRQNATTERLGPGRAGHISPDARFITFSSGRQLVPGDTSTHDTYVLDRLSGVIERVSTNASGTQANENSFGGWVSADGRFVSFYSWASDIVPGDTNGAVDIFVHDRTRALEASYTASPPTSWTSGQTKTYDVTVKNVGTEIWRAAGATRVRLGIHFGGSSDEWHVGWATDQRFSLPADVAPGGTVTLSVSVTAPVGGGNYVLRHRMVKEGVSWFEQIHKTDVGVDRHVASYVSTPPTSWFGGQTQSYVVRVRNDGQEMWNATGPNRVRLGVHFGTGSDAVHTGWATDQRFELAADVPPGESADLTVNVTSPSSAGDYVLRHRMVKEGVVWFDQIQKTNVTIPALSAAYSGTPPTSWITRRTQSYVVRLTNTGAETWRSSGTTRVRLGVHFGTWSDAIHTGWVTDQRFTLPTDVAPGASVELTVNVTAPPVAGSFVLRHRMVKETIAWFPQMQKTNAIVDPALAASLISTPPTRWHGGQTQTWAVSVRNTGTDTWNAAGTDRVRLGVHFGAGSDAWHDGWVTDQRFALPNDLPPGAATDIFVTVTAPPGPGSWILRLRMVKETVAWFDKDIHKTPVTIPQLGAAYGTAPPTAWYLVQTQTYTVSLTNIGVETWRATGTNRVRLGVHFGSAADGVHVGWATDERFALPADVAPGGSVEVTVSVKAPLAMRDFVLRHRMVKEGVAWFDQIHKAEVTVDGPHGTVEPMTLPQPSSWLPGQTQSHKIRLRNTGQDVWNAAGPNRVRVGVHFGTASNVPHDGWATDQRFDLPADIPPGGLMELTIDITAPTAPGSYWVHHRMVKEGMLWFAEWHTLNATVGAASAAEFIAA